MSETLTSSPSPSVVPPPPAPSSALTTRAQVEEKLIHHLELAYGTFSLCSPISTQQRTSPYLAQVFLPRHFQLDTHVAADAIAASRTFLDLAEKICELKNITEQNLFTTESQSPGAPTEPL